MTVAGFAQLAEVFGVSPDTVKKWRTRYPDFPAPVLRGVWEVGAVKKWAAKRGLPKKGAGDV